MFEIQDDQSAPSISYSSSVSDESWHGQTGRHAFEYWHFDALSDDGREALIITFNDNYPFSLRYLQMEKTGDGNAPFRFPAVSFVYSVDGKTVVSAVNEFRSEDLSNSKGRGLTIGNSSFRVEAMEYGSGYFLQIDLVTARNRRIKAKLEWVSIESDLLRKPAKEPEGVAAWNIVAPRSDVSGRIEVAGRRGSLDNTFHFRGTGYHDHFRSGVATEPNISSRCWGRAHFTDSTVVFQQLAGGDSPSKLFLVRDGEIKERNATVEVQNLSLSKFGLKVPARLLFTTEDNIRLRVKPFQVIHSGFFEVKMLSEITLMLRDGKARKTKGILTFLAPERLRSYLFRRLSDMHVGRNGKPALF